MNRSFKISEILHQTWVAFFSLLTLGYCWYVDKKFVVLEGGSIDDGYASQVNYVIELLNDGDFLSAEPLYWMHGFRTVIALFFNVVYDFGGAALTAFVMMVFVLPVIAIFKNANYRSLSLLLILFVSLISYRAVLVFVGIGYIFLYAMHGGSKWYLFFGFLFANLSSGAVLTSVLISIFFIAKYKCKTISLYFFISILMASLIISLIDKYLGFSDQGIGYEPVLENVNGVFGAISRSTIFVSFIDGNFIRLFGYLFILLSVVAAFIYSIFKNRYSEYRVILLLSAPAFLLEGLGVISIIVPILMFIAGVSIKK